MNAIVALAELFAVIGWIGAAVSWFRGAYHLSRWWGRVATNETTAHRRKTKRAALLFLAWWALGFGSGLIAAWVGGWQNVTPR